MEALKPLEMSFAKATKDLPHLPKGLRDWLYDNVWWLVIIGVVLSAFSIASTAGAVLFALGFVGSIFGSAYAGSLLFASVLAIAVAAATIVIEVLAIKPLQNKQKRGWDLLFLSLVVGVAGSAVAILVRLDIIGLFGIALGAAIGIYFLFELRGHYTGAVKATPPVPPPLPPQQ